MCVFVCVCVRREHVGTHSSVNIMLPADIAELFRSEGLHPRRMTLQPWATHRETRQHSKGVFLKSVLLLCTRAFLALGPDIRTAGRGPAKTLRLLARGECSFNVPSLHFRIRPRRVKVIVKALKVYSETKQ